jgi:FemAB-related protein (PEP-CTERM system-associated)
MSTLRIDALAQTEQTEWDAYVQAHPRGTFFHLSAWRDVVYTALGHRSHYLLARRHGRIVGLLPLGEVKSALFGHALISVPFCVYGGVVADDDEAAEALEEHALEIGTRLGVDYVELRNTHPRGGGAAPTIEEEGLYVTFRKVMEPDIEANLKAVPRKQRAMVRKGINAGLTWEIDEDVDRFFHLYSLSVRNLGTPVLPLKWFRTVKAVFGDAVDVLTVSHEGEPVASVLSYYFRDEVLPYYGGGGSRARELKANDFMYYALMEHALARGARVFDYGRSKKGSGSYSFKKNWGFEPRALAYSYRLVKATDPPALNPNNPRYRTAISVWQRLPVALTQVLGPRIARYLA